MYAECEASSGNTTPSLRQNALIRAVLERDSEKIRASLRLAGKRDFDGMTALMHAAQVDYAEGVRILMSLRENTAHFWRQHTEVNLVDLRGKTALIHAAITGAAAAIQLLARHEHGRRDLYGRTALHYAAMKNDVAAVQLLVEYEANIFDGEGRTALFLAIEKKAYAVVPYLLAKEAKTFVKLARQRRSLPHSDFSGRQELVAEIRRTHSQCELCETDLAGDEVKSALTEAIERQDILLVRMTANAAKGLRDHNGQTSLMIALDRLNKLKQEIEGGAPDSTHQLFAFYLDSCRFLSQFSEESSSSDVYGINCAQRTASLGLYGREISEVLDRVEAGAGS